MLPSDDPLMKQSSVGSTASALTGDSWAWKLWRWCLWGRSRMLIQPFFPPVMSSWCLGAMASTVAPESWQQNAEVDRHGTVEEGSISIERKEPFQAETVVFLTMNEAAARSHQSVPKTHVPVRTTRSKRRWIKSSRTIIHREDNSPILNHPQELNPHVVTGSRPESPDVGLTLKILNFPAPVSQTVLLHSHLLSVDRPAVAMREEEPTKTKS